MHIFDVSMEPSANNINLKLSKRLTNLQRHALPVQSGVHYVVLGNGLHPQEDHNEWRQKVDMQQGPVEEKRRR